MNILKIQTEILKEHIAGTPWVQWCLIGADLWVTLKGVAMFRIPSEDFYLRLNRGLEKKAQIESFLANAKKANHRLIPTDDFKSIALVYSGKARKFIGNDDDEFAYVSDGFFKMAVKGEKGGITLWNTKGDSSSAVVVKRDDEIIAVIAALRIKEAKQ